MPTLPFTTLLELEAYEEQLRVILEANSLQCRVDDELDPALTGVRVRRVEVSGRDVYVFEDLEGPFVRERYVYDMTESSDLLALLQAMRLDAPLHHWEVISG